MYVNEKIFQKGLNTYRNEEVKYKRKKSKKSRKKI